MAIKIISRDLETVKDPSGDYDIINVDVMHGMVRVRRFGKPINKPNIKLSDVQQRARSFINTFNMSEHNQPKHNTN